MDKTFADFLTIVYFHFFPQKPLMSWLSYKMFSKFSISSSVVFCHFAYIFHSILFFLTNLYLLYTIHSDSSIMIMFPKLPQYNSNFSYYVTEIIPPNSLLLSGTWRARELDLA